MARLKKKPLASIRVVPRPREMVVKRHTSKQGGGAFKKKKKKKKNFSQKSSPLKAVCIVLPHAKSLAAFWGGGGKIKGMDVGGRLITVTVRVGGCKRRGSRVGGGVGSVCVCVCICVCVCCAYACVGGRAHYNKRPKNSRNMPMWHIEAKSLWIICLMQHVPPFLSSVMKICACWLPLPASGVRRGSPVCSVTAHGMSLC